MSRITRWQNVSAELIRNVVRVDNEWEESNGSTIPSVTTAELNELFPNIAEDESVDLTIKFSSSGYSDPGVLCGRNEDCYPPEGDDEREIDTITASLGGDEHKLSKAACEELAEFFRDEIAEVEIVTTPDYPED